MTLIPDTLRALVQPCLSRPGLLRIEEMGGDKMHIYRITVSEADMGRIVGRGGLNILALKALMNIVAERTGTVVKLILVEPEREPVTTPASRWTLHAVSVAVRAYLHVIGEAAASEAAQIIPGRKGQHILMLPDPLPEEIEAPLSRWLSLMGVEGGTRIILDETSAV